MATHPSVLADLVPAAESGDYIDADLEDNAGNPVVFDSDGDGTYDCDGTSANWFRARVQDVSEGDWHAMSGPNGFRVYVGGTIRLPDLQGDGPTSATLELEGLGLTVVQGTGYSDQVAVGEVIDTSPPKYSLVNAGQEITLLVSIGAALPGGVLATLQYPGAEVRLPLEALL